MMSTHSQATNDDQGSQHALDPEPSGLSSLNEQMEDAMENGGTISIELNFNAFADNVPPDRHARRAPNHGDPSVQDFADQALEIAALRAELKRLTRDYEFVKQQVRMRDSRLDALRRELASAQAQLRDARRQSESPAAEPVAAKSDNDPAQPAASPGSEPPESSQSLRPELTSTLEIPLSEPARPGAVPRAKSQEAAPSSAEREGSPAQPASSRRIHAHLIPMDAPEDAIALSRDIVTIGRTRSNDICIPSRAVSRDHARLLLSRNSVTIVDVGSANGCFVNDEPVKRQKLCDGDLLRIGDRIYRFTNASSPAA